MTQKTILTKIKQRFATLSEWQNVWETAVPESGELCIFKIPADTSVTGLPQSSAVRHISKTGDGSTTLKNLPWDSAISLSAIDVEAFGDSVVNLSGSGSSNGISITASHAEKGVVYNSGNTTTNISGAGNTGKIKIPQITTDKYGHVTAAADEEISIDLPSIRITDDTNVITEDVSFGESVTVVTNVTKSSNDTIALDKTTLTLPANPAVTITPKPGNDLTPTHAGTFDVITGVVKGSNAREIEVTTQTVTLPAETTLTKGDSSETSTVTVDGITRKGSFTAVTDTVVDGHNITDVNTTFTIDLTKFATLSDISSAMVFKGTLGTGGTISGLPTADASTVGDCYRVITAATYNSTVCTIGDLWVCNDAPSWVHIPSGDDEYKGTVTKVEAGQGLTTEPNPITTSGIISHLDLTRTNNTSTASPEHGGTFTAIDSVTTDIMGHISAVNTKTVTLPAQYIHPPYTAITGVPTADGTLTHGGTFTVTQPVSDSTGHITAMTTRTYTLPSETSVSVETGTSQSSSLAHSDTFTVVTGFSANGHTITPTKTTYTLPASGNTDEMVAGVSASDDTAYPLLFKYYTGDTTTSAKAKFNSGITANPNTKTITATTFSGNATSASKFNTVRTIALNGDVTGSSSSDGSSGWSITTTIARITDAEIEALFN